MIEIPEHLLQRSREARARLTGQEAPGPAEAEEPTEDAPAAEAPAAEPAAAEPVAAEPVAAEPIAAEPEPEPEPDRVPATVGAPSGASLPPPEPPPPGTALEIGVRGLAARTGNAVASMKSRRPETEPGDLVVVGGGVSEYTGTRPPRWLVGLYTIVPLFALVYILQYADGPKCGQAGALLVRQDGQLLNCDLTRRGEAPVPNVRQGKRIYDAQCASCHLASGAGSDSGGTGRPLYAQGTLLEDFPDLLSHVEFVRGGTTEFPSYGATGRQSGPVVMPAFEGTLSDFDLVSAVAYERWVLHGAVNEDSPSETLPPEYAAEDEPGAGTEGVTPGGGELDEGGGKADPSEPPTGGGQGNTGAGQ